MRPALSAKRDLNLVEDQISLSTLKTSARAERGCKKRHSYKPLPTHFRRDGFNYRQIVREGYVAVYEQTWNGCLKPRICYEVIRIRRRDGFQIGDKFVEPHEVYPNSEAWGTDGFTFTDEDPPFAKLRELAPRFANPIARRENAISRMEHVVF